MKFIKLLFLTAVMAATLISCSRIDSIIDSIGIFSDSSVKQQYEPENTAEPYEFPASPAGFTSVDSSSYTGYVSLTKEQQFIYSAMYDAAQNMNLSMFYVGECSEKDISIAFQALSYDYPQIIWLESTYGIVDDGGKMYVCFHDKKDGQYSYLFCSEWDRNAALNKMYSVIDAFVAENITADMAQIDIEIAVHDWICGLVEYDEKAADSIENEDVDTKDYANAWSAYGALVENKAVCAGYSKAFQLVMNYLGIECVSIRAESEEQMHLLDLVKIDGNWTYVDPTWDDTTVGSLRYAHDYFNLTYEQILQTHTIFPVWTELSDDEFDINNKFNVALPDAVSDEYGYYKVKSRIISSEDQFRQKVLKLFYEASRNKLDYIEAQITYCEPDYDTVSALVDKYDLFNDLRLYFGSIKSIDYGALHNGAIYLKVNKKYDFKK